VQNWLTNPGELEIIHAARRRGHGTLFITLHLGNWEHGGLLLNATGHPADHSHPGRTRRRPDRYAQGRARALRRGHLIIGEDSFAFVEVIKQLQAGADLAVSLDRPPDRGGVPVEFFGHRSRRRWPRRNWRAPRAAR
jgi:lauroyl/myristoyl acyltransferase